MKKTANGHPGASETGLPVPAWTLGLGVPTGDREWREFGKTLEWFVEYRVGMSKGDFARWLGVTPTALSRWIGGRPMFAPARNLLGHLVVEMERIGVIAAVTLIESERDRRRLSAPAEPSREDRIAFLEAKLRELEAKMKGG